MRIVYIVAGAAGAYCGACARDVALVRALMARDQDVQMIPLYTPLRRDDDAPLPESRIFFGGINVYLQQMSAFFQHTPGMVDWFFDRPALLKWASQFSVSTQPAELGPLTCSMLAGREGRQRKELRKLISYLRQTAHPHIVTITNSLLSGIAPEIKTLLRVPIVCLLQGEERFIASLPEPYRSRAWRTLQTNAHAIDLFIAPHAGYADYMANYLGVPRARIQVISAGIDVSPYRSDPERQHAHFRIGYLSAISPAKGLDVLIEALRLLIHEHGRRGMLQIAGRIHNTAYWHEMERIINTEGLAEHVEYVGEVEMAEKIAFLRRASVFCLPTRIGETRGMAVLEAMATGLPVIVPEIGIFPELIERTQGGLLVPRDDPAAIAQQIIRLQENPLLHKRLAHAATEGVEQHYSADAEAEAVIETYRTLLTAPTSALSPPPPWDAAGQTTDETWTAKR